MLDRGAKTGAKVKNVRFRQIDLSIPIDQPAASIDGVLCRWGYMLLEDPESALRETRRILKQDGTLALAAWTGPDDNLWSAAPTRALLERGLVQPPQHPGQFTWADPNLIIETMEAAGFVEPEVDAVDFVMRFADFDDWWTHMTAHERRRRRGGREAGLRHAQRRAGRARKARRAVHPTRRPSGNSRQNLGRDRDRLHRRPCITTTTRIWTC